MYKRVLSACPLLGGLSSFRSVLYRKFHCNLPCYSEQHHSSCTHQHPSLQNAPGQGKAARSNTGLRKVKESSNIPRRTATKISLGVPLYYLLRSFHSPRASTLLRSTLHSALVNNTLAHSQLGLPSTGQKGLPVVGIRHAVFSFHSLHASAASSSRVRHFSEESEEWAELMKIM